MGIELRIESEDGREITVLLDPQGLVQRLLPSLQDAAYPCLRFVDPYGDTIFNHLQVPHLLEDLRRAVGETRDHAARLHGEAAIRLVQEAEGRVHTYVKFYGD